MDTTPALSTVLARTATGGTAFASATYVIAEPTITHVNPTPNLANSAAFVSMRIITVGGLTLLLVGLCCLAAVLLRFSQHGEHTIHRIEREKVLVLNQETINKSFPIRVYHSQQRIFLDKDDQPIAAITLLDHESFTSKSSLGQSANKPTATESFQQRLQQDINSEDEKVLIQFPPQHSFMGLGLVGRLWSRDSSRCNSTCNSPHLIQAAQMPTFTTTMTQKSPVLLSTSFAIPIIPEQASCETLPEPTIPSISEDICSICLGEYVTDDQLRVLPCSHEYHTECIDVWLTLKSTHCPLCKHDLLKDVAPITPTTPMHIVEVPY
ncbi:hypothetical protein EC957_005033 [Mortierella hygrophila]|uniref:RING-type domain-containing protein n=1 Tax=Mortierella hygrophila TaxID=979708 RepID=A0A9P6FFP2_9FUNG|nr:hypothetical protein EC957_005033 [Mortierella hygrophila]